MVVSNFLTHKSEVNSEILDFITVSSIVQLKCPEHKRYSL